MKIRNLLFWGLLISALFYSCNDDNDKSDRDDDDKDENVFCFKYEGKPSQTISASDAKKLQQEYIKTRAGVLKEALSGSGFLKEGEEDVRDVTFDLVSLKKYIAYVEKKAKEKKLNAENLGIRIYLGAYPKDYNKEGFDIKNRGLSTFFFMPVKLSNVQSRPAKGGAFESTSGGGSFLEGADGYNFGNSGRPPEDMD